MLEALEIAKNNFSYSKNVNEVWVPDPADMTAVNRETRVRFDRTLDDLAQQAQDTSPLGWVVSGPPGSGKTHLLGSFCQLTRAKGGVFILVDMTTVTDFWEKAAFGFVRSISPSGNDAQSQYGMILDRIGAAARNVCDVKAIAGFNKKDLTAAVSSILGGLYQRFGHDVQEYQDVIRAVLMLGSRDFEIGSGGNQWLEGSLAEGNDYRKLGFSRASISPDKIVAGLSWITALDGGFSVLAIDQFDGIVKQYLLPGTEWEKPENHAALQIIQGICNGLIGLRDVTRRCQVVVSCIFSSWSCLLKQGVTSLPGRYLKPINLERLASSSQIEDLVAARLKPAFDQVGKTPLYPTYPFPIEVLRKEENALPRDVLKKCRDHLERCVNTGAVTIYTEEDVEDVPVEPVPPSEAAADAKAMNARQARFAAIDAQFRTELDNAGKTPRKEQIEHGAEFWEQALECFIKSFCKQQGSISEANLKASGSDIYSDEKYPLHARLEYEAMDTGAGDRNLFLCAFTHPHHKAFLARLNAAKRLSGLKLDLPFRRLMLVDLVKKRQGDKTVKALEEIQKCGGCRITPTDQELSELAALARTAEAFPADWEEWAANAKPMANSTFLQSHLNWLLGAKEPKIEIPKASVEKSALADGGNDGNEINTQANYPRRITVGRKLMAGGVAGDATLATATLKQHAAIFAGSGSGKTVLMKRLVEEAALCGVPAVLVDCGNDLVRMGQPWLEKPTGWTEEDQQKADEYFQRVEVKVWTPGISEGNPLNLRKLPDLAAYIDSPDELEEAVKAGSSALGGLISLKDSVKNGIVCEALRWMAKNGGGDLTRLAEVLAELPDDCGAHSIEPAKATTIAASIASQLRGKMAANPQLKSTAITDVSDLLVGRNGKTRISVVNLSALGEGESQQIFVNELAMALFSWIKRNPKNDLQGLFALDEAKDFTPSMKVTPCTASVERFASQARKYGMGFIMATQEPRSVSNKIINNCNTQFYGKQNSTADVETVEKLLQKRNVVGKLETGFFFLKSVEMAHQSFRMASRWCLSSHPSGAADRDEILHLAKSYGN